VFAAGRNQPVGIIKTSVSYDLTKPEALNKLKTEGFLLAHTFTELAPGPYQIRAVVREKTGGAVGSNYQFFEVPDTKDGKISISSVLLTPAGQTSFGGMNSFKAGKEVDVRYIIYGQPKDVSGLTQRIQLVDAQGRVLMDSPLPVASTAAPSDPKHMQQGTRLPVPMVRGRYALLVTLRDAKGKTDIERRADFVVD
jgi:hypothetical protein